MTNSKQITLLEDAKQEDVKEEKFKKYHCKRHYWANEERDFLIFVNEKTGENKLKCRYCLRVKQENKQIKKAEWEHEKDAITPYYVKRKLSTGKGALKMHEIPEDLIEAAQAVIKLGRIVKDANKPIKVCKEHGDLFKDDVIKQGKNAQGEIKWKCKQCMKRLHKEHYELNKAKVLAYQRAYREKNPERVRQIKYDSWFRNGYKYLIRENLRKKKYKELYAEKYRERDKRRVENLEDSYVKKVLMNRSNLKSEDIPDSLVEIKRALIILKRNVKKAQDEVKISIMEETLNVEK